MNVLQKIFTDYYEVIKYTLHARDNEIRLMSEEDLLDMDYFLNEDVFDDDFDDEDAFGV